MPCSALLNEFVELDGRGLIELPERLQTISSGLKSDLSPILVLPYGSFIWSMVSNDFVLLFLDLVVFLLCII